MGALDGKCSKAGRPKHIYLDIDMGTLRIYPARASSKYIV